MYLMDVYLNVHHQHGIPVQEREGKFVVLVIIFEYFKIITFVDYETW